MNKRRSGMVLIAFGLVTAILVGATVFQVTRQAAAQKVETVGVVVALQDIPERTALTPALVGVRQVLPDGLPPGVLTRPEQVNGRMTTTRLFAGEMVLASRLADSSGRSGIAYTLEKGRVLITLPASDVVATGAVRIGDHVDLLVTILPDDRVSQSSPQSLGQSGQATADDETLPATTQTTMQNLIVVGIGPFSGTPGDTRGNGNANSATSSLMTFAVSHEDALVLKALKDSKRARLELVLRAAGDEEIVETEPVTLQTLLERYRIRPRQPGSGS